VRAAYAQGCYTSGAPPRVRGCASPYLPRQDGLRRCNQQPHLWDVLSVRRERDSGEEPEEDGAPPATMISYSSLILVGVDIVPYPLRQTCLKGSPRRSSVASLDRVGPRATARSESLRRYNTPSTPQADRIGTRKCSKNESGRSSRLDFKCCKRGSGTSGERTNVSDVTYSTHRIPHARRSDRITFTSKIEPKAPFIQLPNLNNQ
jgi:hypothetical protein